MSQLTQYISGQTPPTEYFSAQRIIDGKVFNTQLIGGTLPPFLRSTNGGTGVTGSVFGGHLVDYLVKVDSKLLYSLFKSDASDNLQNGFVPSIFLFMCGGAGAQAYLAPLNNGLPFASGSAGFIAQPPAQQGVAKFLTEESFVFLLPAGRYFYIGLDQSVQFSFSMSTFLSFMYGITLDNMQ